MQFEEERPPNCTPCANGDAKYSDRLLAGLQHSNGTCRTEKPKATVWTVLRGILEGASKLKPSLFAIVAVLWSSVCFADSTVKEQGYFLASLAFRPNNAGGYDFFATVQERKSKETEKAYLGSSRWMRIAYSKPDDSGGQTLYLVPNRVFWRQIKKPTPVITVSAKDVHSLFHRQLCRPDDPRPPRSSPWSKHKRTCATR